MQADNDLRHSGLGGKSGDPMQSTPRRAHIAGAPGMIALITGIIYGVSLLASPPLSASEPSVPPGLSTKGAIMVALVGPGIDYRLPELQGHLARDGEGDLIGWDFSDSDNKPFADGGPGTAAALHVMRLAPKAQLISVKERLGDRQSLGHLMTFVANTPARIIVWLDADPKRPDWPILAQAIKRFSDRLFIVGTVEKPAEIVRSPVYLGVRDSANALLVSARDPNAQALAGPANPTVAITIRSPSVARLPVFAPPELVATVVAAALAARAFQNGAQLNVASVKALIAKAAQAGITYQEDGVLLNGSHPELALR